MYLTFDHVTKLYGPVIGINDVNCRMGPGLTGLLGVNGAGKSTMLKLASGQLRPTQGRVLVGELTAWRSAAKSHMGYSPDLTSFYADMTGRQFVYAMARLYGDRPREAKRRTEEVLEDVGMTDRADRRIQGYSHGMRQRVKLAQALIHDPTVLLLDEPLAGIDPGGRRELSELMIKMADRGKTLLVSTHMLSEIEHLADSILMIARGRVIASGTISEVRNLIQDQPFTMEVVAEPPRRMASMLIDLPAVHSVEVRDQTLTVRTRNPVEFYGTIADLVIDQGIEVHQMRMLDAGADAIFDYLQKGSE